MVRTSFEESGRSKVTRSVIAIMLGVAVVAGVLAPGVSDADYRPYPVVLVHGRDNSATSWNTIWPYLRSRGVSVTAYSITDAINECVELWGREIGDRAYCQASPCPLGRTWMEQAQSDLGPFSKCKVATFSTRARRWRLVEGVPIAQETKVTTRGPRGAMTTAMRIRDIQVTTQ